MIDILPELMQSVNKVDIIMPIYNLGVQGDWLIVQGQIKNDKSR